MNRSPEAQGLTQKVGIRRVEPRARKRAMRRNIALSLALPIALLAVPGVASAATADAAIGFPHQNFASGFGVFNTTGKDQTRKARAKRGNSRVFDVTVENAGDPGRIDIEGCASSPGFRVRYTSINGADITESVVAGTYGQDRDNGATVFASATIKATNKALVGDRKVCKVSGIGTSNRDVVKAILTVKSG